MKLRIATPAEDTQLRNYFESFELKGSVDLHVNRPSGFFEPYKLQSDDFETHALFDDNNDVKGIATLLFREGQIQGHTEPIGYATDLRISPTRLAITNWTDHFLPITSEALQKRNAKYLFSVISTDDAAIQNTLVRPRSKRRNIPIYHLVRRFEAITIVGHLPFIDGRLKTLKIERAQDKDLSALSDYIRRKTLFRTFAFSYTEELLRKRFTKWPGFRADSFILAKDKRGNIVGCVAPWSSKSVQNFNVLKYNGFSETAKSASKIGSWFNLSTPLPPVGSELEMEYLTHFYADNQDIFETLLEEAYLFKPPRSLLNYTHFYNYPQTLPPTQFLCSRKTLGLFVVAPIDIELPRTLLHSPIDAPPDVELPLI